MSLAEEYQGAIGTDQPSEGNLPDDPISPTENTLTYTRISIGNCVSPDGEVSDRAIDILDAFPSAYMELNQSKSGIDILLVGEKPRWCKSNKIRLGSREVVEVDFDTDWMPKTGNSFSTPVAEEIDHTEALEDLCSGLFPADKRLFHSDREEIFEEPTEKSRVHHYIQKRIRDTQSEYLSVIWDNPADLLIMLAILDRFLEKGCEYEGYDIKGDFSHNDIRLKTGLSRSFIGERLKFLHLSNYPLTLTEKQVGKNRRYRLSSSHTVPKRYLSPLLSGKLKEANNKKNPEGFHPYIVMDVDRRILNFTSLSNHQKYLIMLLRVAPFLISDLYEHANYKGNRDNFRKYVLKELLELGLIVESKKVVSLAHDTEDRIGDMFEEERYETVQEEVAKAREDYKEMVLYGDVDEDVREEILKNRNWNSR